MLNYFDETREPVGVIYPSSLILAGAHGRLSNIDDDGNFIRDEAFALKGKEVLRKAGSSARGLMRPWVKLRRESEDARKMLEHIEVVTPPFWTHVSSVGCVNCKLILILPLFNKTSVIQQGLTRTLEHSRVIPVSHLSVG